VNTVVTQSSLFSAVKVVALEFVNDHALLRVNETDWTKVGTAIDKPEFQYGKKSASVSYTQGQPLKVKVTFEVWPQDAAPMSCTVGGVASWGMTFGGNATLKGGAQGVVFTSREVLPGVIAKLYGEIQWMISNHTDPPFQTKDMVSWGYEIFVTAGTPMNDGSNAEDGVTTRRMRTAVEWVETALTSQPHAVVAQMRSHFRGYALVPDTTVPMEFQHPKFDNAYVGGAWPLAEFVAKSGECQAQVRLVRAMLRQLGVPGRANVYVVWAEPQAPDAAKEADLEADPDAGLTAKNHNGKRTTGGGILQWAALVDSAVAVGQTYKGDHAALPGGGTGPGRNQYEACLRFEADGTTKYYGGGSDVYPGPNEVMHGYVDPAHPDEPVAPTFWGLVWTEEIDSSLFKVVEIVKVYVKKP
jgi:hypothetical protein